MGLRRRLLREATNSAGNTHQYTGHERDAASGLDYMHYRYHAANLGRFMKPDNVPGDLTTPQSWNLYAYALGSPVNFTDPTGHMVGIAWRGYTWAGGDIAGTMLNHQQANSLGGGIGLGSHGLDAGFGPDHDSWFGLAGLVSSRRYEMVPLPSGGTSEVESECAQSGGMTQNSAIVLSDTLVGIAWELMCGVLEKLGYTFLSNGLGAAKALMEGAEVSYSLAMYNLTTSMRQTTEALYQSEISFGSPSLLSSFDAGAQAWSNVQALLAANTPFALSATDRDGIAVSSNALLSKIIL